MIPSPEPSANVNSPDQVRAMAERLTLENDELRQMNAILRRSNQDLERFAFAASHDLQEPLRGIAAYAELLGKKYGKEHDEEFAMFLGNIVQGATRMRTLLGDLLAYAEIGATSNYSGEVVDLNLVLEKVRQNLQMSIEENGASVVSTELPMLSAAHEFHFVQLFQNLVGNGIKYRSELKPLIQVSVRDVAGNLEFAVADNGLGVAPEYHQKIFQAFQRLHDNKSPGTGIGLAICQRVVERYGGRIWVDSKLGHGATFRFTLPIIEVRSRKPALSERSGGWKVRIVLVDDNPADVSLLRFALDNADLDCELIVINDGAEALAFVRQQGRDARNSPPDLAVLDFNLPKSDGLQILKAMRENRAFTGVPVAVLSSGLTPRDLAKLQEFSLLCYITKPSTLEEFLKLGWRLKALIERGSDERSSGALALPQRATTGMTGKCRTKSRH
jgi:nitrogen-specific signal transduction histidine kinase/DNA-binding NarL/FixJ family response regulator